MSLSFEELGIKPLSKGNNSDIDFSDLGMKTLSVGNQKKQEVPAKTQEEENFGQSAIRTAANVGVGYAEGTPYGIATNLINLIGTGEALDPLEIERIKEISEREGIPFDEEKYMKAVQGASSYFPTPGNIARITEEQTGLPLEAKTDLQKAARLAGTGGKITPGTMAQKMAGGSTAALLSQGLQQQYGVPEQLADLLGLTVGASLGSKIIPPIEVAPATKPSGLPKRGFEELTGPREVTEGKLAKINKKVEKDFRNISDKIIAESPVGETFENLKNDPSFKQASRELMQEAQTIADSLPGEISTDLIATEMQKTLTEKPMKGYMKSEYEKSYHKHLSSMIEELEPGKATAGKLVEQYRKNNDELTEYFQPGESKAVNRGKRDALLDHNRAIASVMEKQYPDSELVPVFKEGNERWTKIMDAEVIDDFVTDLFGEKINFKELGQFFDKKGYTQPFKRALGPEKFKQFEQVVKDLATSEAPYKMLKVAKGKGFLDLAKTMGAYMLHPKIAAVKLGVDVAKSAWKGLMNSLLDKPQLTLVLNKAVRELKQGKFAKAEKDIKLVQPEVLESEKAQIEAKPAKASELKGATLKAKDKGLKASPLNKEQMKASGVDSIHNKMSKERFEEIHGKPKRLENKESKKATTKKKAEKAEKKADVVEEVLEDVDDPYPFTKEDFPTKQEALDYLEFQERQYKANKESLKPHTMGEIQKIKRYLETLEQEASPKSSIAPKSKQTIKDKSNKKSINDSFEKEANKVANQKISEIKESIKSRKESIAEAKHVRIREQYEKTLKNLKEKLKFFEERLKKDGYKGVISDKELRALKKSIVDKTTKT